MLTDPLYTQPAVLKVTRLKPQVLQTWVNRGAIQLSEQKPGRGSRRLYSKLDVVKLAVMRRFADLRIDLSEAKKVAEITAARLLEGREIEWDLHISFKPTDATARAPTIVATSSPLMMFNPKVGDAYQMRVGQFTELESGGMFSRRTRGDSWAMIPERREEMARLGIHAEPVIIFPLGEVVNGTLAQLRALDQEAGDERA